MHDLNPPCLLAAWSTHEADLRHRLDDLDEADDLLHDTFLKVPHQGSGFCAVRQPRAWLFQVTRNGLTDQWRTRREPDDSGWVCCFTPRDAA